MRISKWVVTALMLASLPVMAGEVYKWIDAGGRIHYGDQPQPGWKRVEVRAPGSVGPAAAVTVNAKDQAAARAACEKKRKDVESYKAASRIVEQDALGREKEYSEDERNKLIEMTRKQADQACSGQALPEPPPAEEAAAAEQEASEAELVQ